MRLALEAVSARDHIIEGSTLVQFEHEGISRVKFLLAEGSAESLVTAWHDVERLRAAAESGHHRARLVEILALAALVCEGRGQHEEALGYLRRSVELGAPAGFCRTYVDLGPAIGPLLAELAGQGVQAPYLNSLLDVIGAGTSETRRREDLAPAESPAHELALLTTREGEVLDALCRRLSYQEIAQELFISVYTVKSHINHIYEKLGVANRRQAMTKAEALGVLPWERLTHRLS